MLFFYIGNELKNKNKINLNENKSQYSFSLFYLLSI